MVSLANAATAGQLAAAIATVTAQLQLVSDALAAGNVTITSGQIFFQPNVDAQNNLIIQQGGLTIAETTTVLTSMQTILNARLTTYNAQLAGLS